MPARIDLVGMTFERLTVTAYIGRIGESPRQFWLCRCSCGNELRVQSGNLKNGHTRSCGCLMREAASKAHRTHGQTDTRLYCIWEQMKVRCLNEKTSHFHRYGGRGIRICARWVSSFEAFLEDMGHPPEGYSLDRIDTDGDYEPGNCRWASAKVQQRNRRNNSSVMFRGRLMTYAEMSEITGVGQGTIRRRIVENGWTPERAASTPSARRDRRPLTYKETGYV